VAGAGVEYEGEGTCVADCHRQQEVTAGGAFELDIVAGKSFAGMRGARGKTDRGKQGGGRSCS
jgi:hypothetical protein